MKCHRSHFRAFTLIELMIVVAIIAIIAAIAIPNMIRSRMAANESAAIAACKEYAAAQDIYRRTDWDSDGILEYATSFTGGNSLYTKNAATPGDIAMIEQSFANAEGQPGTAVPKAGYVFMVLTGQGATAPGGSKSYVVGTDMTIGYGLSAMPASYDQTGRNSFQINSTGTVYQKDQGSGVSTHLTTYEPDTSWTVSE
ncbi:MAG: DUF2950 family protein [Planctomycetes bacterium]|nr:DUF2950 family protein [Planctomycetota bacterium]